MPRLDSAERSEIRVGRSRLLERDCSPFLKELLVHVCLADSVEAGGLLLLGNREQQR